MRADVEVMSDAECVQRLRSQTVGRLGLVDAKGRPLIFPVNYFFDEGVLLFRTGAGTKHDLAPGNNVCFEIDGRDPAAGESWSVLVRGIARDLADSRSAPTGRMKAWPVRPLAPGAREHWIGIWVNEISGRRFEAVSG